MKDYLETLSVEVGRVLKRRNLLLATAESCSGGWVAKIITDTPGSSAWFERGFVTYSNLSKQEMLGVRAATLETHGAVSEQTVQEMAEGALQNSAAQLALAVSGIAGPAGEVAGKPVGTVCFAWASEEQPTVTRTKHFSGDRKAVRRHSVETALQGILAVLR